MQLHVYVNIRFYIRYSFLLSCWHLNRSPSLTRSYHLARWRESGWVPSAICWLFWLWRTDVFHIRPATFPSLVIFKWKFSALKPAQKVECGVLLKNRWWWWWWWWWRDSNHCGMCSCFFSEIYCYFFMFSYFGSSCDTIPSQTTTDRACKRLGLGQRKQQQYWVTGPGVWFCSISGLLGRCHLPRQ